MRNDVAQVRLWSRSFRGTTVGIFSLAFLFAFEWIAVATIMPVVAQSLQLADALIEISAPVRRESCPVCLGRSLVVRQSVERVPNVLQPNSQGL